MGLFEVVFLVGIGWLVVNVGRKFLGKPGNRIGPGGRQGRWVWQDEGDRSALPPSEPPPRSETTEAGLRTGHEREGVPVQAMTQQLSPKQAREKQMTELRRRYVADDITVEEYEAELDKLMRS